MTEKSKRSSNWHKHRLIPAHKPSSDPLLSESVNGPLPFARELKAPKCSLALYHSSRR